jgi:hypothetical protein
MSKRSITKKDKERADKLRELGCIVCLLENGLFTPPAIHHIDGQTKKNCHKLTIPLCPNHHQIKDNFSQKRWISRHADGRAAFEEKYGTEQELLEETNRLINADS